MINEKILPKDFQNDMLRLLGDNDAARLMNSITGTLPAVSIRINPAKDYASAMIDRAGEMSAVPWCPEGYYLKSRPAFTFDPLFHGGAYYVQDASSMFVAYAIRQLIDKPVRFLDLCAAPGGKTTLALSALPEGSVVVANEAVRQRAKILRENVIKWGRHNTIVTNNFAEDFNAARCTFDVIMADLPCSGEGMFRKDDEAIRQWSSENVEMCMMRQREIISNIWQCLKPGGLLFYSTCTFNTHENEENIRWICDNFGAKVIDVPVNADWNIAGNMIENDGFRVYRFFPDRLDGEGFFFCIIQKEGDDDDDEEELKPKKKKKDKQDKKKNRQETVPKNVFTWLSSSENYDFTIENDNIIAIHKTVKPMLDMFGGNLNILMRGTEVAHKKGKDYVPSHPLSMNHDFCKDAFPTASLSKEDAIKYLRSETLQLPASVSKGFVAVMYQSCPLGFVNNLGSRANNMYPSEWRIRSTYTTSMENHEERK